jgi:hypothetical protein
MTEVDIEEYKKIGVDVVRIYNSGGRWLFKKDGREYNMAPSDAVGVSLSPTVLGANRVIEHGCKLKGIKSPEDGFYLLFSTQYFPNSDVKLNFKEIKFDGWVYSLESMTLQVPKIVESIWVCPYLGVYYAKGPPKTLYLRIIPEHENSN